MHPKIKNPQLVKTKLKQICQAAEELFSEKGYHKTTIRDIASRSRISIGSIYDYIKNKEDILFHVLSNFFSTLNVEIDRTLDDDFDAEKKFEAVLDTMIRHVDRYQEYVLFTYRDSKYLKKKDLSVLMEQEDYFISVFKTTIQKGIDIGVFNEFDPEIVANMMTITTHAWALKRYNLKKFSLYTFKETVLQLALKGMLVRNETKG